MEAKEKNKKANVDGPQRDRIMGILEPISELVTNICMENTKLKGMIQGIREEHKQVTKDINSLKQDSNRNPNTISYAEMASRNRPEARQVEKIPVKDLIEKKKTYSVIVTRRPGRGELDGNSIREDMFRAIRPDHEGFKLRR